MGQSRTWDDDQHVLHACLTGDPDYPIEFELEHPKSCKVYVGCTGPCLNSPGGWHVDTYYDCPAGYQVDGIGVDEALFGLSITGSKGYNLLDEDPEYSYLLTELCRQFLLDDEAYIGLKLHWSGGFDYWGEWDDCLEVEPVSECTCPATEGQVTSTGYRRHHLRGGARVTRGEWHYPSCKLYAPYISYWVPESDYARSE